MSYEIRINHEFCAAHAIRLAGELEAMHGHNFRVTAVLTGERLDEEGLLCDFHAAHARLVEICRPFENVTLNGTPPFDELNPTAERLAEHIALSLDRAYPADASGDRAIRVASVAVSEAPGCEAVYRP